MKIKLIINGDNMSFFEEFINYLIENNYFPDIDKEEIRNNLINNLGKFLIDLFKDKNDTESILPLIYKHIEEVDEILTREIEYMTEKTEFDLSLNIPFELLLKMEKLKNEVKKRGIQFLVKINIVMDFKQFKELCRSIFGVFDLDCFAYMNIGDDEDNIDIIKGIVKELFKISKEKFDVEKIKEIGHGEYSKVYLIGNYVLKIGYPRNNIDIPNDRRILQPIIRGNINESTFIEVQNKVDMGWFKYMSPYEINEILFQIYVDLRKRGKIWIDIKKENVGKLLLPNKTNIKFYDFKDKKIKDIKPTREATGLIGEVDENDVLGVGEYVIVDTDHVVSEDRKQEFKSKILDEFEKRYLAMTKEVEGRN